MPLKPKHERLAAAAGSGCSPGCPPKLPSLARRAKNFGKAMVKHVAAGRPKRSTAGKQIVLATCQLNTCGNYIPPQKPGGSPKCAHPACGCNLVAKAGWADQACPVGLWTIELPAPATP